MSFKQFLSTKEKPIQSNVVYFAGQTINQEITNKYDAIAKEAYQDNPIVNAIINKQSDIFAGLPFILERKTKEGWETVNEHPVLNLIQSPNDFQAGRQFLKELFSYYRLAGYAYIKKMRPSEGRKPVMLYNVVPNAYEPISGSITGEISAFRVVVNQEVINKKEVIYIKGFDPLRVESATSPVKACGILIDTYNSMMKWNMTLMKNGAVPPILVKSKQKLSQEQKESITENIRSKQSGWKNSGKPMIQDGDNFEIEVLGIKPAEAQFLESMQELWRQICVTLGMAPELMGSEKGTTFNNRSEAMKDLYLNLILPTAEIIIGALNIQLLKEFEPNNNYRLNIDRAQIDALHESQDAIWKRAESAFNNGLISTQEARHEMGFDSDSVPHSEAFFMPSNKVPIQNV